MSYGSARAGFVFIRVPRTGSTTLLNYLAQDIDDLEQRGTIHTGARQARELWRREWYDRHTFGVIRNPWDWLVSFYNAGISYAADPAVQEIWPGAPVEPPDAPGIHPGERMNMAFPAWVRARRTTPFDWLSVDGALIVDEVRRFEDIAPAMPLVFSAVPHRPYEDWYTPDLREYVAEKCRREIELGGYIFGEKGHENGQEKSGAAAQGPAKVARSAGA